MERQIRFEGSTFLARIVSSACVTRAREGPLQANGANRLGDGHRSLSEVWLHILATICNTLVGASAPLDDVARAVPMHGLSMARMASGRDRHASLAVPGA